MESYIIFRHKVDTGWPRVTAGEEFKKLILGVNGTRALAIDTNEWCSGEEAGTICDGWVDTWGSQLEAGFLVLCVIF
jgi:hypothetical protein